MPQPSEVADAIAVLSAELDRIDALPGSEAKIQAIRKVAEEIRHLFNRAAEIRKGEMFRIRDEEELSLAQLAGRVGISKARADQMIRAAAKQKEASDA